PFVLSLRTIWMPGRRLLSARKRTPPFLSRLFVNKINQSNRCGPTARRTGEELPHDPATVFCPGAQGCAGLFRRDGLGLSDVGLQTVRLCPAGLLHQDGLPTRL